jgi:hypothetical protein
MTSTNFVAFKVDSVGFGTSIALVTEMVVALVVAFVIALVVAMELIGLSVQTSLNRRSFDYFPSFIKAQIVANFCSYFLDLIQAFSKWVHFA